MEVSPLVQVAVQAEEVEAARREARDLREENSRWVNIHYYLLKIILFFPQMY